MRGSDSESDSSYGSIWNKDVPVTTLADALLYFVGGSVQVASSSSTYSNTGSRFMRGLRFFCLGNVAVVAALSLPGRDAFVSRVVDSCLCEDVLDLFAIFSGLSNIILPFFTSSYFEFFFNFASSVLSSITSLASCSR